MDFCGTKNNSLKGVLKIDASISYWFVCVFIWIFKHIFDFYDKLLHRNFAYTINFPSFVNNLFLKK
ncbi:hypothetical protein VDIAB_100587 [Vibrio diabolicus]|nr:hypothetical protein VDIAB_100587 [Vibrio diabolicus]